MFWAGFVLVQVADGLYDRLRGLLVMLLVSLFLSFAIEPRVNALARKGWRRGPATGLVFAGVLAASIAFTTVMGSLVVNQVQNFIDEAPEHVQDIEDWVNERFDADVELDEVIVELRDPEGPARRFASDLAGNALDFSVTALGVLLQMFTVALFTFYLVADGPRLRRAICSRLPPERQRSVLRTWELAIDKTGGYLYSRVVLAGLPSAFHAVAFSVIGAPYPVALALWVGVVSQFVPVVGTYLAGALAVLVSLLNEPVSALWALAAITVYQQIENYLLAPRITAHTLSLHAAVAFGCVIAGASLLGPVGALLALPAAAVIQAFISTIGERHEIVESKLTSEPQKRARRRPKKPS
jgi:predicted PurR-regulated permease PerM